MMDCAIISHHHFQTFMDGHILVISNNFLCEIATLLVKLVYQYQISGIILTYYDKLVGLRWCHNPIIVFISRQLTE